MSPGTERYKTGGQDPGVYGRDAEVPTRHGHDHRDESKEPVVLETVFLHSNYHALAPYGPACARTVYPNTSADSSQQAKWDTADSGKTQKVREVPLNATARLALYQYLEMLPREEQYLFHQRRHTALTGRALGHLVTKYATQPQVSDLSSHDLRHRRKRDFAPMSLSACHSSAPLMMRPTEIVGTANQPHCPL